jgi:hypothetical protein
VPAAISAPAGDFEGYKTRLDWLFAHNRVNVAESAAGFNRIFKVTEPRQFKSGNLYSALIRRPADLLGGFISSFRFS